MYDDTESPSKEEGLPDGTCRPLPAKPTEETGTLEDEYESFNEESSYAYISRPYETEEPNALSLEINTAQSTFTPLQRKGSWRRHLIIVLLALVGVCLLIGIILLTQHAAIFSELKKLNFSSTQESCEVSTAFVMIKELKIAVDAELKALEKHIKKGEASDRKVAEQIYRIEEKMDVLQNARDTCTRPDPLQWHKFQEKCYYFSETREQWENARNFCATANSHLVIINSKQEQDFVVKNIEHSIWLGLSDAETESHWRWVDGSQLAETFWRQGEPNDGGRDRSEDCAVLYKEGKWNDISCGIEVLFACEKRAGCVLS
ncbi:C-type lectin domain family 17, member A-like [Elgaria multicarinata webbii]|uniref:C-type lectin domain family 17, member A-like n=1 Tax=Elgaria multicarinata webbii TaxID=159646 RepID=UPI002FCCFDF8